MLAIKNNELLMEYLKVDFQDKQLEVLALTSNSKYTNGSIKVKLGTVVPLEFENPPIDILTQHESSYIIQLLIFHSVHDI